MSDIASIRAKRYHKVGLMKAATGLGFAGGVFGVIVGLGVIIVATANGDTPFALVDRSIAADTHEK